jgi:hypothetical protein
MFEIIKDNAQLPSEFVKKLPDEIDAPTNGTMLDHALHILFDHSEWCLHTIVNFATSLKHNVSNTDALESRVITNTL